MGDIHPSTETVADTVVDASAEAGADPTPAYPIDTRDGWEPGAPSLRNMAPSAIGGAIVPLGVYFAVRHQVHGDATALIIAGIPATAWVVFSWIRHRRLDPIGAIVLLGFVFGVSASYALGGNSFVLKVRDSAFTCIFGLLCLVSVRFGRRPMMFHIGKAMSAGDDDAKAAIYDQLWDIPPARVSFRIISTVWGVGLIVDATIRVLLAASLSTSVFLAVSPAVTAVFIGSMFAFTVGFTRWSRNHYEEVMAVTPPSDGDATWFWIRYHARVLRRRSGQVEIPAS